MDYLPKDTTLEEVQTLHHEAMSRIQTLSSQIKEMETEISELEIRADDTARILGWGSRDPLEIRAIVAGSKVIFEPVVPSSKLMSCSYPINERFQKRAIEFINGNNYRLTNKANFSWADQLHN